jgi:hypothetical protein
MMNSVTEGSWVGTNRRRVSERRPEGGMSMSRGTRVSAVFLLSGVFLLLSAGRLMALQVGDKAPDFSLPATTAEKIGLADYLGKKSVVVFFYIGAFTAT